jgi:hypothetical protein
MQPALSLLMKVVGALVVPAVLAATVAARGAVNGLPAKLPPPAFTVPGYGLVLTAAGARVGLASGCEVRVADLVRGSAPVRLRPVGDCATDPSESAVNDLWLGRARIVSEVTLAPSPHGSSSRIWAGPLPAGPLRPLSGEWGWAEEPGTAADVWGCDQAVVSGGGLVALAPVPNWLGVDAGYADKPTCRPKAATEIVLDGGVRNRLTVAGAWSVLATDGKRLLLAELAESGRKTGVVELVDLNGTRLPAPAVDVATAKAASGGWLTPDGAVLVTKRGISGPSWAIRDAGLGSPTLAEGRLFYRKGRTVRVRRVAGGVDRALVTLPLRNALLAAGSFGLAVAVVTDTKTTVYRLPWRTIDRILPLR